MSDKRHSGKPTPLPPAGDGADHDLPILLQDHALLERMARFNREQVPERQVNAKGGGAFGRLEVTGDVSAFTRADLFQPGRCTELLVRFSTLAGERGSPDVWRDPRGFAVKFYTAQGNYDVVGSNSPVFFIRDPMKFTDLVRSQKRRPDSDLHDHDMQWAFWTSSPESAHQVAWLMGDRGIPRTWRNMDGFSGHTFLWVNAAGERSWVRYHFKTDQGIEFFSEHEAGGMAADAADLHKRDLWEAIERGDLPSWSLKVQIMPFGEASAYRFNPFDVTKVISQRDYPLIDVGTMTLDRNPTSFHNEIEQAAFEPSNLVPGIGPSPDRMLLARLLSYPDAHRYRIGINYNELPVNRTIDATAHAIADDNQRPVTARLGEPAGWEIEGETQHAATTLHDEDDDSGQAGTLVREVLDDPARSRLVENVVQHLGHGVSEPVLIRAFHFWRSIDKEIGDRVEEGVRANRTTQDWFNSAIDHHPGLDQETRTTVISDEVR